MGNFTLTGCITPSWPTNLWTNDASVTKDFFQVRVIAHGDMTQDWLSAANNFMSVTDDNSGGDPHLCAAADRNGIARIALDTAWSKGGATNVGKAVLWRVVDTGAVVHAAGDFLTLPVAATVPDCAGRQLWAQSGLDMNANGVLEDGEVKFAIILYVIGVDIRAQGQDSGVVLSSTEPLTVTLDVIAGAAAGYGTDWWCLAHDEGADLWYYYVADYNGTSWLPWAGGVSYQAPLFDMVEHKAVAAVPLPAGTHGKVYFGVDLIRNGLFDLDWFVYAEVDLTVTP